ncbi:hypothetical protein [Winogradskyella aurantiaca]|uniref:hypothetical protein n=1 Tax=Winogradskyella aurantiaca TaxID=2219558 RepID=UPI001300B6B8|nr:hypothetical protein [Winogradskyella aurantiaca]
MKIKSILILALLLLTVTYCSNPMNNKLNTEDFDAIKESINTDNQLSDMKKKYVIDNLSMILGFAELGKAMNVDDSKILTFGEQIEDLKADYDSIRSSKIEIKENNKLLDDFIKLVDVDMVSIDKYNGYLNMTLDFNNKFDKEVLYIVMEYKYVNKYDTKFFSEKSKLTDKVAKGFNGEVEISTQEKYNSVARFLYSEVPIRAEKSLRDELGDEVANEKVKKEFLMEGLKVSTLGVVFNDKTELMHKNADWEYLEN